LVHLGLLDGRLSGLLSLVSSWRFPVEVEVDVLLELFVLEAFSLRVVVEEDLPLVRLELHAEERLVADVVEGVLVDALRHVDEGELEDGLVEPLLLVGLEVLGLPLGLVGRIGLFPLVPCRHIFVVLLINNDSATKTLL